jgi:hypothetical protein
MSIFDSCISSCPSLLVQGGNHADAAFYSHRRNIYRDSQRTRLARMPLLQRRITSSSAFSPDSSPMKSMVARQSDLLNIVAWGHDLRPRQAASIA